MGNWENCEGTFVPHRLPPITQVIDTIGSGLMIGKGEGTSAGAMVRGRQWLDGRASVRPVGVQVVGMQNAWEDAHQAASRGACATLSIVLRW